MTAGRLSPAVSLASALFAAAPSAAQSPEPQRWFLGVDLQAMIMDYRGSTTRDRLTNAGVFVSADYLERAGVTFGFNRTTLADVAGGSGGNGSGGNGSGGSGAGGSGGSGSAGESGDIDQDNVFLSLRYTLTPDRLPGRLVLRLDGYDISNDDATGASAVTTVEPRIAYSNYAGTFAAGVGFARSEYGDGTSSDAFEIEQWTPTLGFGLNERRDWLQLRAYLINGNGAAGSAGALDTSAAELKWTHWLTGRPLGLDNIRFGVLAGERLFAVDSDAGSVYNLTERQTGAYSVGAEWKAAENGRVLLLIGSERYENAASGGAYRGTFVYLGYSYRGN